MSEFAAMLNALRRPRILIRAARAGLGDYRRDRDLRRVLRGAGGSHGQAIRALLAEEARLEEVRATGEATYSLHRHIAVLTALLAEARQPAIARQAA